MTYTNPANPNRPMEPASIVQALDDAAVSGPLDRHAWDYDTNVVEVVVDHEARTIMFKVKQTHRSAIAVLTELRESLPDDHHEVPGVVRSIEVLRYA